MAGESSAVLQVVIRRPTKPSGYGSVLAASLVFRLCGGSDTFGS